MRTDEILGTNTFCTRSQRESRLEIHPLFASTHPHKCSRMSKFSDQIWPFWRKEKPDQSGPVPGQNRSLRQPRGRLRFTPLGKQHCPPFKKFQIQCPQVKERLRVRDQRYSDHGRTSESSPLLKVLIPSYALFYTPTFARCDINLRLIAKVATLKFSALFNR